MRSQIEEAEYDLVHGSDVDAKDLAYLSETVYGTLCNMVNSEMDTPNLSNRKMVLLSKLSKNYCVLYADAEALNHTCIPLGDFSDASDMEVLTLYTRLHKEIGEFAIAMNETLKDGRVTRKEYNNTRSEFFDAVQAGFELMSRLEALIDERPQGSNSA